MSKQVDFYLIENQISDAKYKLASRLANKLLKLNKKALIITDNPTSTESLDQWLWSFSGTSFVAHEQLKEPNSNSTSNIDIAEVNSVGDHALKNSYDVLINLAANTPDFCQDFERIAEIVEQNDDQKAAGRQRYKNYKEQGFTLKTHSIEL